MAHKLLLADDSVTIQRVIELTFADEDVQVIAVGDGKRAIERVQADRPDIVLADIGMPERDGYEVAAFIKGDPQLKHIPVLLLTGAFEPIDETRARTVGCDGVLVKPFEPQMVISRVKDLLSGRRPAGLWASAPAAQTPVRPPAPPVADVDLHRPAAAAAAAPPKQGGDSLEAYFDRLDAAFSAVSPGRPERPPEPVPAQAPTPVPVSTIAFREVAPAPSSPEPQAAPQDDLTAWHQEPMGGAGRPGIVEPAHAAAPHRAVPPAAPAVPRAAASMPPLSEAFAALLAAEQRRPVAPAAFAAVPEDAIDEIVRRVIDRMSNDTVRRTVVEVAERMVREEIERLKSR